MPLFLGRRRAVPTLLLALGASCASVARQSGGDASPVVRLAVSEGFIPVGPGISLFYRVIGSGRDTVLVVHGIPSGLNSLAPDLLPLARGRTLIFYDQRANDRSTLVSHDSLNTARHAVADLDSVRRFFKLERVTLMGHSWGGLLVGLYGAEHPERVNRMVLVAPIAPAAEVGRGQFQPAARIDSASNAARVAHLRKWRTQPADSVKACWDYWSIMGRGYYADPDQSRRGWGDVCNMPQATMLSPIGNALTRSLGAYDARPQLRALTAPVLVITGDKDPVPTVAVESWVKELPSARLVLIPGSGHLPFVDNPAAFFPDVDAFLRGSAAGAAPTSGSYERLFDDLASASRSVSEALNRRNWTDAASRYTTDAMLLAPGGPPVSGRTAIAAFWGAAYGRGLRRVELQTIEVESSGALAVELGKFAIYGEGDRLIDAGKFMALFRGAADGWQLYRDAFSSSLEHRSTLEVPDYLPAPAGTWKPPAQPTPPTGRP